MVMPIEKTKVELGRQAVDAYREAHRLIHQKPYYRSVHDDHTPLLNKMKAELKRQGFNSFEEFFAQSEEASKQAGSECYVREGECNRCGVCCEGCEHYLGEGVCDIYETRPQICIDYPTAVDFIRGKVPKECSYSFTKIKNPDLNVGWQ